MEDLKWLLVVIVVLAGIVVYQDLFPKVIYNPDEHPLLDKVFSETITEDYYDGPCKQIGSYCVTDIGLNYEAINTCEDANYDNNLSGNKYCNKNYWAGAKKACSDIHMKLPDIDTYIYLYKNGFKGRKNPYYWSSDEQDENLGRSFTFYDGTEYSGGYYKNFHDNVLCIE